MHPNNPYATKKPDFAALARKCPSFAQFVTTNDGFSNIDWQNVDAVRELNKALLKEDWSLEVDMKKGRLCPPIPNRLDYLYHLLDLMDYTTTEHMIEGEGLMEKITSSKDRPLRLIDIGTGAMVIYPILFHRLQPTATIIATEEDDESLSHARQILSANNITSEAISVLEVPPSAGILFPLLKDKDLKVDLTMCNPPFYSSSEELQAGVDLKADGPHAAASGAYHELVCEGGEAAFVGQMIEETSSIGSRCTWFTSLIGRYASLSILVAQLRREKIDNYYIIPSQPAKTVRWILVWSHTLIRLPDSKFRSGDINPSLLPPTYTWHHEPNPPLGSSELHDKVITYLKSINIEINTPDPDADELDLKIIGNTWSRAARRKLKLQQQQQSVEGNLETPIHVTLCLSNGKVEMTWKYGKDRADVESFWNSMLAKTGLINRSAGEKRVTDAGDVVEGSRKVPKNRDGNDEPA